MNNNKHNAATLPVAPAVMKLLTPAEVLKEQRDQFVDFCMKSLNQPFYDEVVFSLEDVTGAAGRYLAKKAGIEKLEEAGWRLRYSVYKNGTTKLLHISAPEQLQHAINCDWFRRQCLAQMLERGIGADGFEVDLAYNRHIVTRRCMDPFTFTVADDVIDTVVAEMVETGWLAVIC